MDDGRAKPHRDHQVPHSPGSLKRKGQLRAAVLSSKTESFTDCSSANNGDSKEYCLGLLEFKGDYKKDDLTDQSKWQKLSRPLLRAGGGIYCTGHNSFFLSPDGSELWIAFHGRTSTEEATWHRPLCFMKAKLDKNGNFIMESVPVLAGSFMKEPSRNG